MWKGTLQDINFFRTKLGKPEDDWTLPKQEGDTSVTKNQTTWKIAKYAKNTLQELELLRVIWKSIETKHGRSGRVIFPLNLKSVVFLQKKKTQKENEYRELFLYFFNLLHLALSPIKARSSHTMVAWENVCCTKDQENEMTLQVRLIKVERNEAALHTSQMKTKWQLRQSVLFRRLMLKCKRFLPVSHQM